MFQFEMGETVEIEDGRYAKVIGFAGDRVNLEIAEDGELISRTIEDLLNVESE